MSGLFPVPLHVGTPDHRGPWIVVNSRGYAVATGFDTKHHAWRWIIGPTYVGPHTHKWREPYRPRPKPKGKWRHYATGRYREVRV